MQKIRPALARLEAALDKLDALADTPTPAIADAEKARGDLAALDEQCAHLRAEISALKKGKLALETDRRRISVQIDKAMRRIDDVLQTR